MKFRYIISAALIGILCSCTPAPQPQPQESEKPQEKPDEKPDDKPDDGAGDDTGDDNTQDDPEVDVITWDATNVSTTSALLSGSYEHVTTELRDHGFYWGTSEESMTGQIGLNSSTAKAADFEATLTGLEPGTTYYFKAYVTVWDPESQSFIDIEGAVSSFTTKGGGDTPPTPPGPEQEGGLQYLGCYEMPAISLLNPSAASDSGTERVGSSKWYNYLTTDSGQMVVTHTYKDGGKVIRNWTALVDKTKKASLWNAFVMHDDVYPDNNVGRYGSWKEDPGIPSEWQSCFSSSGFSRGHQVASNYRQASTEANSQTFYYTNEPHSGMSYSQGITTIDAMEQRSGFDFYANVPAQFQDAAESSSSPIW